MPGVPEDSGPRATFQLRVRTPTGLTALRAAPVATPWRVAGRSVDALALGSAFVLVAFYRRVIGRRWPMLAFAGAAAWLVYVQAIEWRIVTLDTLFVFMLLIPTVVALRRSRHPADLIVAYWSVALLVLVNEASAWGSLSAVFVRRGGTDFLTYEAQARSILNTWSLQGGENVFYYQPLFRYVRFGEHLLFGDGDVLVTAFARTSLIMSAVWLAWTFRIRGYLSAAVSVSAVVLLLALFNGGGIVGLLRNGVSEYPTWIAFPVFFSMLFRRHRRRTVLASVLLGASLITRLNQAPGLLWLFGVRAWTTLRSRERRFGVAVAVLAVICLLPVAHNLYYGRQLVLTTSSAGIPENLVLRPAEYWEARHDEATRTRVVYQVGRILYGSSANARPERGGGGLRPVFRGLQVLWLMALIASFMTGSVVVVDKDPVFRLKLHLPRLPEDLDHLLILISPAFFLAPHLFYQVDVYYPRHIVIGHLAMAAAALYATGVLRPALTARRAL